jgi:2-polyprenyl-3-methyl-5-hydroxy-6-metoxy-1,4-benzoquinol methylase
MGSTEHAGGVQRAGGVPHDYDSIWRDVYGDMQDVGPTHRHLRRLLDKQLARLDYDSAIDIGCGAGHNFEQLAAGRRLEALAGADLSPEALRRARERWPGADLHELDVQARTLDGRWDLVLCSLVLEHLPDDEAALRNMREMTAPGGHLVAVTIAGDFERYRPWEEQMGHVRNYRRGELEEKLALAGFDPVTVVYWGFPFYSPLARRLQNSMTSEAEYGAATGLAARVMYWVYWLNSSRRGDLVLAIARRR